MSKANQPILISITPGGVFKAILVILFFYFLYVVRDLVLALITAIIVASALEPMTLWLTKRKIPRVLSVLIIYLAATFLFSFIFYLFVPILVNDTKSILENVPQYVDTLSDKAGILSDVPAFQNFVDQISQNVTSSEIISQFSGAVGGATYSFVSLASSIFGGLLSFVLIIVLSFYLAVQEDGVAGFLKIITPIQYEKYVIDLWKRARNKIGLWMQGQLLLAVLIGVLTYLGLSIFGIENSLLLALVAAVFELIPVFGPVLAAVPAVAFAFIQDGLTLALITTGLYVVIQQFESQLIHPLVVKKIVGIPALVAIIALIIGAQIAGFIGIIISVPIAAAIMEYINDVEKKKTRELKVENV